MTVKTLNPAPEDNPVILNEVPDRHSKTLTDYDKRNLKTYLRLLDAASEGAEWEEAARLILKLDPKSDPKGTFTVWHQHMERARWMTAEGWKELADIPDELLGQLK